MAEVASLQVSPDQQLDMAVVAQVEMAHREQLPAAELSGITQQHLQALLEMAHQIQVVVAPEPLVVQVAQAGLV
jgi:ABC-type lipoprotein export system ATPase subunit